MAKLDFGGLLTPRRAFLSALAFLLAAAMLAVVFGALWAVAGAGDDARHAAQRDEITRAAESAVRAYTEFDHEDPEGFKENQLAVSTDAMREQIELTWPNVEEGIAGSEQSASTTVFDIAVDDMDLEQGRADVIAALGVDVTHSEQAGSKRIRIQVEMERVADDGDEVWKLAGIDQVPVIGAGAQPGEQNGTEAPDGLGPDAADELDDEPDDDGDDDAEDADDEDGNDGQDDTDADE